MSSENSYEENRNNELFLLDHFWDVQTAENVFLKSHHFLNCFLTIK